MDEVPITRNPCRRAGRVACTSEQHKHPLELLLLRRNALLVEASFAQAGHAGAPRWPLVRQLPQALTALLDDKRELHRTLSAAGVAVSPLPRGRSATTSGWQPAILSGDVIRVSRALRGRAAGCGGARDLGGRCRGAERRVGGEHRPCSALVPQAPPRRQGPGARPAPKRGSAPHPAREPMRVVCGYRRCTRCKAPRRCGRTSRASRPRRAGTMCCSAASASRPVRAARGHTSARGAAGASASTSSRSQGAA